MFPLFATGVIDTGGKFAAGVVDTSGKLPPVSTTLAKLVAKFAAGVADTGGKFAAGVVDTGGNFAAGVVDTGGAPLLATRIFEKIRNDPKVYSGAWGKLIHEKKPKVENLVTLSL